MAPVRLTVSPSLIVAVVAEDHDADIVGLEVEGHALDAAGELDHLAGLDLVEAVDAGDAVADRQHLADLGDIGLGAEILAICCFRMAEISAARISIIRSLSWRAASFCSFDFSELSIMRLPTLTIRPPSRLAIDLQIDRDLAADGALQRLGDGRGLGVAQRHRRGDGGCHLAAAARQLAEIGVDHIGESEEAAVLGDQRHEAADEIADPGLLQHGAHGLALIGAGEHGAAHEAAQIGAAPRSWP